MKKRLIFFVPAVLAAAALILVSAGCSKKAEEPAEAAVKEEAAPAPEEYTQEKPYTREDPGPWADVVDKHIPEITYEKTDSGLKVTVKVDDHPMDPQTPHYIMWIKLEDGDGNMLGETDFVATDPAPVTTFDLTSVPAKLRAYERCNIHGIWTNETDVQVQ
jgi:desulfoferrodoxin-like iron-binding protein